LVYLNIVKNVGSTLKVFTTKQYTRGSESSDLLTTHAAVSRLTHHFFAEKTWLLKRASTLWLGVGFSRDTWSRTESGKIVQHLSNVKHADEN